jgi:hypothetical protein
MHSRLNEWSVVVLSDGFNALQVKDQVQDDKMASLEAVSNATSVWNQNAHIFLILQTKNALQDLSLSTLTIELASNTVCDGHNSPADVLQAKVLQQDSQIQNLTTTVSLQSLPETVCIQIVPFLEL